MSKATRKRSTPSGRTVSRGGVTLRIISGGAACKPSPRICVKTASHADLRAELRRLRAEHSRLVTIEMGLEVGEGEPGYRTYRRACAEAEQCSRNLSSLTNAILRRPRNTPADVSLLAEAHVAQSPGSEITLLDEYIAGMTELEQRTLAALLTSALKLGGSSPELEAARQV